MPVQRISKAFKDVSATFQVNPLNYDVIVLNNANAIARSVRNLVFTIPGEKPFQPDVGSRVSALLFENMDQLTANSIEQEIKNTINNFEPRVKLREVRVTPNYDANEFNCLIRYDIIGAEIEPQRLTFALQPTR